MKKVSSRALFALLLALILAAGMILFAVRYCLYAGQWAAFPGSPHLYSGQNLYGCTVSDRSDLLLLDSSDQRSYSTDEGVRRAVLHLLGDREGCISAPLLSAYADEMAGFDLVNGLYRRDTEPMQAKLTICAQVQDAALRALGTYSGTVGVYNYRTGEILCAVSSPSYDPDNVPDIENDTSGQYDGVYVNRFFDTTYTPGSIFKLVTAAAALSELEGIEERTFTCTGQTILGGQKIICSAEHGELSFQEALAHSCNVAFGEIAQELGGKTLEKYAQKLGLTEHFSCDGFLSSAGKVETTGEEDGNVAWAGIGQYTDQVNAYAFLRFMGVIAGGGEAAEPYLMEQIRTQSRSVYAAQTESTPRLLSESVCEELRRMMRNNVSEIYGDWQFGGLSVCAKSGTAEHEARAADAMFAGFVEGEEYPLAFVVFVEKGGSGSAVAAPIAAKVLESCVQVINSEK